MDWRDRFRAPVVIEAAVARDDPDRGVVISDRDGNYQAYAWNRASGTLRQVTDVETAVLSIAISPDGNWIYVPIETEPGTELGHIHRYPFEGGRGEDLTPELDPYPIFGLRATRDGVVGVGALGGLQAVLVVERGQVHVVEMPSFAFRLAVSDNGRIAGVSLATPGKGMIPTMRLIALSTGEILEERPSTQMGTLYEDRAGVSFVEGDWMRPGILANGEVEPIDVDIPGDVLPVDWSRDGSTILLQQSYRSGSSLHVYDVADGGVTQLQVPEGASPPFSRTSLLDESTALVIWSDARTPRRAIEARADGWRIAVDAGGSQTYPGPEWEEFEFDSSDDARIQGWLLRPPGTGPWPTVVYTHGGPTAVAGPVFSPIAGAWYDSGFAVASINYRGSTTFGHRFREALTGNIGGPDVDDVVAARHWLVDQGIADPDHIVKNGYSYGGYLTLQALGTHPDLWAAGAAGAPIADWTIGYDDMNDVLKAYDMSLWGSRPDERPEQSAKASPRTYVSDFRAPLVITQPVADSRTPVKPVQVFVDELKSHGKEVELHLLEGGHAGSGKDQAIEMVQLWLDFVLARLGMD